VETAQAKTQLIAHDKEVYDIAFAPSTDVFASAGADGHNPSTRLKRERERGDEPVP
jgi:WD40 repeat protein